VNVRSSPRRTVAWTLFLLLTLPLTSLSAQDLIVDGTTIDMGGTHRYDRVRVINGGVIRVRPFDGTNRETTGNLVLIAPEITIDATSRIDARGAGYSTPRCADGRGPSTAGGAGGCSVYDSGGGGAHFGRGGRGTIDCFICGSATSCQFPQEFEADCGNTLNAGGTACSDRTACRGASCATYTGEPSTAGQAFRHSIYDVEFGASGGDKGCRDNDGFSSQPAVGGAGGGRVVLVALTDAETGSLQIDGTVTAAGRRGCGTGNDSGGGGAGGSILLVGDRVDVGATAVVTARGGLGGDTLAGAPGQPDQADCPTGAQTSGTCDDCGGGGGGGIINVLSRSAELASGADFDVAGADGGVCPICRGEAGGGAGELLIDGAYVGELCDGYDNDFDGTVDEDLAGTTCGLGACATSLPACSGGMPVACSPTVTEASCFAPADGARPRVAVVLDTSSSMLLDLRGFPTFGDGSVDRPGLDTDGNGRADDSRLFLARTALAEVISAYPEIDFALARYHQDQGPERSCQLAKWFECAGLIGTYDDPRDNDGPVACSVATSATTSVEVRERSVGGEECINYAGTCGPPRRGADVLSGFGTATRDLVRWLDGRETDFRASAVAGDVCEHSSGGDCEVRASGETPLAGSLEAIEDYVVPIRSTDPSLCREYSVILVTDGAESCGGDPVARARRLHDVFGVDVYVIAVSVLPEEEASLNQIALVGSGGARTNAIFVRSPSDLVPALASIIAGSLRTERCNAMDDDCDGLVDEGFAIGLACDDGGVGDCRGTGTTRCAADELSVRCDLTSPGGTPSVEECNGRDDDCDEAIDEALTCTGECTPTGSEVCNGVDDDCNGLVDEVDPALGSPCGEGEGVCEPGMIRCVAGMLECIGGVPARDEVCNGLDDDCDGDADDLAPCPEGTLCIEGACRRRCDPAQEFPCPVGFACRPSEVPGDDASYCTPTACAACAPGERCVDDVCVDPCEGVTCDEGATCRNGRCIDCRTTGCPSGELCAMRTCREDRCASAGCTSEQACFDGECRTACGAGDCPSGQRCAVDGSCEADPCASTSCDADEVCVEGSCRADACRGVGCEIGQVCAAEVGCVDDPCVTVRCPSGRVCEVAPSGRAECRSTAPPSPDAGRDLVAATGGGGCAAGSGDTHGGTRGLFFAIVLAIVVTRRKR